MGRQIGRDVGEMAVVRDEGTVGVAVPVATTEKGQLAESVVADANNA